MELHADRRADCNIGETISANTAFTDTCIISLWLVHRSGMWMVSFIPTDSYLVRLIMVIIGVVILGFGISLSVIANVIMNSGEAFVKVVSDKLHKEFGNVKISFDVFCVSLALVLSLLFFNFSIVGTREGTIISALLTGVVVKFFSGKLNQPLNAMLRP